MKKTLLPSYTALSLVARKSERESVAANPQLDPLVWRPDAAGLRMCARSSCSTEFMAEHGIAYPLLYHVDADGTIERRAAIFCCLDCLLSAVVPEADDRVAVEPRDEDQTLH